MINEHDLKDMAEFPQPKGLKYDATKPPIALVDPDFIEGIARVLGFGAQKYSAHNWRLGLEYSRVISALYRHLGAFNRGEDIDPESGLRHTEHMGCCIMFLDWFSKNRPELDDRWKPTTKN